MKITPRAVADELKSLETYNIYWSNWVMASSRSSLVLIIYEYHYFVIQNLPNQIVIQNIPNSDILSL